jgi:hypothetical protein
MSPPITLVGWHIYKYHWIKETTSIEARFLDALSKNRRNFDTVNGGSANEESMSNFFEALRRRSALGLRAQQGSPGNRHSLRRWFHRNAAASSTRRFKSCQLDVVRAPSGAIDDGPRQRSGLRRVFGHAESSQMDRMLRIRYRLEGIHTVNDTQHRPGPGSSRATLAARPAASTTPLKSSWFIAQITSRCAWARV